MKDEIEVISGHEDIVYNQDRAVIDTMVATAKAYPRNIRLSTQEAIEVVTMDAETAGTCTYSVPRGGRPITGPSVHLARILVQQWGNIRAETKVIDITDKHVVSQAVCFDIQKNVAVKVEVKRSIMTRTGRMSDDMITVTGNAGNAIAYRNAVFAVIPKSVVDKVHKAATGLLIGDVSDETKMIKQRKVVFDRLKTAYGPTDEEILGAIGKSQIEYVTADDLVTLVGIGTAIKDGDTTVDQAFRPESLKKTASSKAKESETNRVLDFINKATSLDQLKTIGKSVNTEPERLAYKEKEEELGKQ